jgi:hypothetical protein
LAPLSSLISVVKPLIFLAVLSEQIPSSPSFAIASSAASALDQSIFAKASKAAPWFLASTVPIISLILF